MSTASRLAEVLPDYEVSTELGRGAMGIVHLGRHRRLDRNVAIKELPAAFAADPEVRERFLTEARVLAGLDHPHVVPVYDYVERDGYCVLVMEELPGGTVWDRFTSDGFTMAGACAVVMASCAGLHHAHEGGVLHRDVKPENLMFAKDGALKVTDFGIAKMVSGQRTLATMDGGVLGTPAYMAPEQAEGKDVGKSADVYALGVMLFELLSGRLPFEADTPTAMLVQRVTRDAPDLRTMASQVPDGIAEVAMAALSRSENDRPGSAEELGVELGHAAASAWGPDWLDGSGLVVRGADRLVTAARTTISPATGGPSGTTVTGQGDARATIAPSDGPTVGTGAAPATVGPDAAPVVPEAEQAADDAPATPDLRAEIAAETQRSIVKPTRSTHLAGGVDLNDEQVELVDVADVIKAPAVPWWALAVFAVAAAVTAIIAMSGVGDPAEPVDDLGATFAAAGDPIELDLSDPVTVRAAGVSEVRLGVGVFGQTIATGEWTPVEGGTAEVEPGLGRWFVAGNVTGTIEGRNGEDGEVLATEVPFRATQPWFATVAGGLVVLGVLLTLAYAESNLRPLRRGRRRMSRIVGAGLTGALAGATAVLGTVVHGSTAATMATLLPAVATGGVAGLALAWFLAGRGRRRRMKKAKQ